MPLSPLLQIPIPAPGDGPPFENALLNMALKLDALFGGAWTDLSSSAAVTDSSGTATNMGTWTVAVHAKPASKMVPFRAVATMTAIGTSSGQPCLSLAALGWTFAAAPLSHLATWADSNSFAAHFESSCGGANASVLTLARLGGGTPPGTNTFHVNDRFGMNGVLELA